MSYTPNPQLELAYDYVQHTDKHILYLLLIGFACASYACVCLVDICQCSNLDESYNKVLRKA